MSVTTLTFHDDSRRITYTWFGGFGAIFKSFERKVQPGDTRVINGELFYVSMVWSGMSGPEVCWSQLDCTSESIRALKRRIFGCE